MREDTVFSSSLSAAGLVCWKNLYVCSRAQVLKVSNSNNNNTRPSLLLFLCCRLQNIVERLWQFLLERLSVRFKQQVLVDEEPREDYADELEQIRNQGEAIDVVQHTIGGD